MYLYEYIRLGDGLCIECKNIVDIRGFDPQDLARHTQFFRDDGKLVDATFGGKIESLIIMDNGFAIASNAPYERVHEHEVQRWMLKEYFEEVEKIHG